MANATKTESTTNTTTQPKPCPAVVALHVVEMMVANPPKRSDTAAREEWRETLHEQVGIVLTTHTRAQIPVDMGDGIKGNISPKRALAIVLYGDQYGASVTRATRIRQAKA